MKAAWKSILERNQQANEIDEGFDCGGSASWHTLRDIGEDPDSENLRQKMIAIAKLLSSNYG